MVPPRGILPHVRIDHMSVSNLVNGADFPPISQKEGRMVE